MFNKMDEIIEFDFIENQQQQRKSSDAITETSVIATPTFTASSSHTKKKLEARLPTIASNFSITNEHQTRKDHYQKSKSIDNSCLKSNNSNNNNNSTLTRGSTKKRKVSLLRFSDDLATTSGGNNEREVSRGSLMRKKKYSLTPEHYKKLNFHHVETVVQTSLQPIKMKTVTSSSPNCEISTKILKPNDYFFLSIFTSLFCCFPIGINIHVSQLI